MALPIVIVVVPTAIPVVVKLLIRTAKTYWLAHWASMSSGFLPDRVASGLF